MGPFVLLGVLLVLLLLSHAASRRRERRRREREEAARRMAGQSGGGGGGGGPLGPFGAIFESLFDFPTVGGGMWSQSYTWDEATGQWVEMPDGAGEPAPAETGPQQTPAPAAGAETRTRETRPAPTRKKTGFNPFGGLMGGLDDSGNFSVEPPATLPTFEDVGGMDTLKQEVRDSVGLMLAHPEEADRYGIEWNGVLLHGPTGVGKTYFARAIAGEYRMNLIHVATGDLVSSLVGKAAHNIDKAFETAAQNLPCLLFFDEFDSVAQRRDTTPDQEARRTVNQLLTALEAHRGERRLLVMAATNSIEHLDPAVIRPGRFDRHIRIDLPDLAARRAIFAGELDDRPAAKDVDLDELARRTEGLTPAGIEKIVETAALRAFREATDSGKAVAITTQHLMDALGAFGGQDRPMVEHWNWESLILPEEIKSQLQQLQAVIEDPESARRFGVDPPTGLLLAGPPGTGKTTIAKVLAAQANCSFYPVSGADVMSKWVGESEGNIRRLFERARANRPSIVFVDEIDAIAGRRGQIEVHDTQVNQLLAEIDGIAGQRGVFVIGATNRPDQLDPALLRGGRLSRTIVLGLPDEPARLAMLKLHSARMPTVGVRLDELAAATEGFSPADLKALCQEAALAAMARETDAGAEPGAAASVTHEDFEAALLRLRDPAAVPVA